MFSGLISDLQEDLFNARLDQAKATLQAQTFTTEDECQAAVYSILNGIMNLGNNMTPLAPIRGETPAIAGDLETNLQTLNSDSAAVVSQLVAIENNAAAIYNLLAASQNAARQRIREFVFGSTQLVYNEDFVNNSQVDAAKSQVTVDPIAGLATAPLISETQVVPEGVEIGVSSVGATSDDLSLIGDGVPQTSFTWNGSVVELVFDFGTPQTINRITISLNNYKGAQITSITSSPDGNLVDDILSELPDESSDLDATSCKYSGEVVLDFTPKSVRTLGITLSDSVGQGEIGIRDISFYARKYASQGTLQSVRMNSPIGNCVFSANISTAKNLTSIAHHISFDGINFRVIQSGDVLNIPGPFWYKAGFNRSDANFSTQAQPIATAGTDLAASSNYQVGTITTVSLSTTVIERSITLTSVSGAVQLQETPLPGTLVVYIGAALAPAGSYSFANNVLNFPSEQSGVSIRYQTSAFGNAGLTAREEFYTPYLHHVQIEKT